MKTRELIKNIGGMTHGVVIFRRGMDEIDRESLRFFQGASKTILDNWDCGKDILDRRVQYFNVTPSGHGIETTITIQL